MDCARAAAPLTVACVLVRGPYPYTPEYVIRLERMVRRYVDRPFRFVCLTDYAWELAERVPGCEVIAIDSLSGVVPDNGVGYWNKLRLFDPAVGLEGRVLFLDLDTLVVADLAPIVDFPATFALTTDALVVERSHLDRDRYGRRIVRKFNSSVMVFDAGSRPELFTRWTPAAAQRLSTDQDWIAEQAIGPLVALGMPYGWFPRISRVQPPWSEGTKVVLVKKPKNHEAVARWPWFDEAWGGWS